MCDEYLASFESQLVNLTAVSSNLNRKIEFNSRFKDAVRLVALIPMLECILNQDLALSNTRATRWSRLINAKRSSQQAEQFSKPAERARHQAK